MSRRICPHVLCLLSVLFSVLFSVLLGVRSGFAQAQEPGIGDGYVPPDYIHKPPPVPERWRERHLRSMRLREAVELALRSNLDLALKRESVRAVATDRSAAIAAFEPMLHASIGRSLSLSPPSTAQEGRAGQLLQSAYDSWRIGITERLPTGALLQLDFVNRRTESTLGNVVAPMLFFSTLSLTLNQPLLSGFSFDGRVQWANVLRAEFDSERAREDARQQAMLTVRLTEETYWSLVQRWKAYEVHRLARDLAEQQLDLTRRKIAAGVLAESDLISAQGTVAQRQIAVVRAEAEIELAADDLRSLLNLPPDEWEPLLLPCDAPEFARVALSPSEAMERAVGARPELKQAQIDIRRTALDLSVARNARLPELDLTASVGTIGQSEEYARALEQIRDRAGWTWSVGLQLQWRPLGVGARAQINRQLSSMRQKQLSREQWLTRIRVEVRKGLRDIETAERELHAAVRSRELAARNLGVEQRRFLAGLPGASNYQIALRQNDLAQAQLEELAALIHHQKARVELDQATGELLEARQLKFEVRLPG